MKAADLLALLLDFYRDKQAMRLRHESGAMAVSHYDFNNMYQYVIAREDVQIGWLRRAVADLGGALPDVAAPELPRGKADALPTAVLEDDGRRAQAFTEKWRDRVETLTNAQLRGTLRVIVGETLEHKRFFEQALAGQTDLLGRRADGAGTGGGVLATRWME